MKPPYMADGSRPPGGQRSWHFTCLARSTGVCEFVLPFVQKEDNFSVSIREICPNPSQALQDGSAVSFASMADAGDLDGGFTPVIK